MTGNQVTGQTIFDQSALGELRSPGARLGTTAPPSRPLLGPLIRLLVRFFAALPLPLAHAIGAAAGQLAALPLTSLRRISEINLEIAFPGLDRSTRRRRARRSLSHTGRTFAELGALWHWDRERVLGLVRSTSGEEVLRSAIASGRGVILATPHLGWELILLYCSANYPMTTLFRPPRVREIAALLKAARERFGARMAAGPGAVLALRRALGRGELVGIAPDQDAGEGGGIFVPLFGVLANTMVLLPRLAAKSGALVVFAYGERLPRGGGFNLHFSAAPEGLYDRDLVASASSLNQGIESCLRAVPDQYLWSYKRYRVRPTGMANPYKTPSVLTSPAGQPEQTDT